MVDPIRDAPSLQSLLAKGEVRLIDVHPEEAFLQMHVPGARNACVYNVSFLDDVRAIVPDPAAAIVVYGGSERSQASATAAGKLEEAGFTAVRNFPGGLEAWVACGFPVVAGEGQPSVEEGVSGIFEVDANASVVRWTGRNFNGAHHGTLGLSGGSVHIESGSLKSATFGIDVTSIKNNDIADASMRGVLIAHLLSDDFLNADNHPSAEFVVVRADPIGGAVEGGANVVLSGTLTLNGVEALLVFPASVEIRDGMLHATAAFEIDRTRWNIIYGSHRFYEALGKHFVSDLIEMEVELVAR